MAVGARNSYLVCFLDEYSRYIVHHELLLSMDGLSVSIAAQAALETLPTNEEWKLLEKPAIRSDNGSCYVSREFGGVLGEHGLNHRRLQPQCPEENGTMERANRTIGEALVGEDLGNSLKAVKVLEKVIRWYNQERLHSALGFLKPVDDYRGNPDESYAIRRHKLAEARHRRKEKNLQLRQPTLPLTNEERVASPNPGCVPNPLKHFTGRWRHRHTSADLVGILVSRLAHRGTAILPGGGFPCHRAVGGVGPPRHPMQLRHGCAAMQDTDNGPPGATAGLFSSAIAGDATTSSTDSVCRRFKRISKL